MRAALRIHRYHRLFEQPLPQFAARPRSRSEVEISLVGRSDPTMPPERKRGTLDATPEQRVAEVVVELPERVEVHVVVVDPDVLLVRAATQCPQAQKRSLVDVRQLIVHGSMVRTAEVSGGCPICPAGRPSRTPCAAMR